MRISTLISIIINSVYRNKLLTLHVINSVLITYLKYLFSGFKYVDKLLITLITSKINY